MSSATNRVDRLLGHLASPQVQESPQSRVDPRATANRQYRYTVDNEVLTEEQRDFYEENGYLLIKKLIPEQDLQRYADHFRKLCSGEVERVPTMTVMRDVSIKAKKNARGEHMITKIQDYQNDPVMFSYCQTPQMLDVVAAFTGPDIKSIHTMLIHKPPHAGKSGRHPCHQDGVYFAFRPFDRMVAAWTAMERVDRNNGCLSVVPGSHKGELLQHGYPDWDGNVNKMYHGILGMGKPTDRVHLPMEAGDTVFFHPLLVHGSGANNTQGYRKAISCHYASSHCQYIDVKGTLHEELDGEVAQISERRFGIRLGLPEAFAAKSRLVRGDPDTL